MPEKVIIYGGAFNPPTIAHQEITQAAADYALENDAELWLMPSGERKDKSIQVSIEKRLAYAHGLLASVSSAVSRRVLDVELRFDGLTKTAETCNYLERSFPRTEFKWLFGSDSLQTMSDWERGSYLIENLDILVVQREGYEIDLAENMVQLDVDTMEISSTEVRERIATGKSAATLVPAVIRPLVQEYR